MLKKYKNYIWSVIIALAVGGLSALATSRSMDIYGEIVKPPLAPPSIVFPVVWSILFALMGISSGKIYEEHTAGNKAACPALTVYAINLGVNFMWSVLFFNLRVFWFAAAWLVLLIGVIILMIKKFHRIEPWAGRLQVPYLIWCCFALYLNVAIAVLN